MHNGWKLSKMSHSTLRAKRATFTIWEDKSSLKMPILANFYMPDSSILIGQKMMKNAKKILASLWKTKTWGLKVLPDRSTIVEVMKMPN